MKPTHIELANHYYHDANDLLVRFDTCWKNDFASFGSIRSRRAKLYVDLAMSLECSYKSIKACFEYQHLNGEALVREVRRLNHGLNGFHPQEYGFVFSNENLLEFFTRFIEQSQSLGISLRYRIDNWDFREAEEELYYETIGCDIWMLNLFQVAKEITDWQGNELNKESRIVTLADAFEEILAPKYNTYKREEI
jgi:hypothetical protein